MTFSTKTKRMGATPAALLSVSAVLLLQGCVDHKPQVARRRLFEVDTLGAAKVCTVPKLGTLGDGAHADVVMTVTNDGGWCAVTTTRDLGSMTANQPFDSGLLAPRPAHGSVYIHTVGEFTRMDYTPARGYAGPDKFVVTLLPGATVLNVSVTVSPGVQPPPPAQAAEPATTSTRRRAPAKKPVAH